jgi:hypothetical protein
MKNNHLAWVAKFLRAVKQCEAILSRSPQQYQIQYREYAARFCGAFAYALHYIIEENTVSVLACFHFRRDPKAWI